ncbi:hypothetical protein IFM89_011866 [Coptis chinensis]|uniref:TF-B3 domain-containing protein n=1 Tax=Coptis chinensis TaxID=261450 RepID=A0A835LUL8_9MAGN|nr:hypothetical protein IFM89_011866 [Coptis chinensis]
MSEDMRPQFFKIIHPSLNTTRQLRIPPVFVMHISKEDSRRVVLEGPSGNLWDVKLGKTEDGTFFQNGWQDFVRDHSLGDYEFLVFRYDGSMCFNVHIFDKTGCEKLEGFQEHAISTGTPRKLVESSHKGPGRSPNELVNLPAKRRGRPPREIVESSCKRPSRPPKKLVNLSGKKRGRPPKQFVASTHQCQSKAPQKTQRVMGLEEVALESNKREDTVSSSCKRCLQVKGNLLSRGLLTEEEANLWKNTMSFTSNVPHFMRCLSISTVRTSHVLKIPTDFAKAHFPKCNTEVALEECGGKACAVNFISGKTNAFCGGWAAFVHGNQLEPGDICLFELVGKLKMCVHIFRTCQTSQAHESF